MNNRSLEKHAQRLAHLAQMLSAGAETAAEADEFYRLMDIVMGLDHRQETVLQGMALNLLSELGDGDSVSFLCAELEMEATLQHVPNAAGHDRSCLLFALPVVVGDTDAVSTYADVALLEDMHEVLHETDVINPSAEFGLVSRLFSYTELFSKSYGQLKRLNRHLARQVMAGDKVLTLPEVDFDLEPLDGASCSPLANLFFVVGLVVTRNSELDNVFPGLPSDDDGMDGGFEKEHAFQMTDEGETIAYDMGDSGHTGDGTPWEEAFCQAFDDAFGSMEGAISVAAPDGIGDDLRRGLELAREIGTLRMFERSLEDDGRDKWARISVLQESEGEAWFDVSCLAAPEVPELDVVRWPVLNHESEGEALEKLQECLADAGIQPEDPAMQNYELGNMLLH